MYLNKLCLLLTCIAFSSCMLKSGDSSDYSSGYSAGYSSGYYNGSTGSIYKSGSYNLTPGYNSEYEKKYQSCKVLMEVNFDAYFKCMYGVDLKTPTLPEFPKSDFSLQSCLDSALKAENLTSDIDVNGLPQCGPWNCAAIPVLTTYLLDKDLGSTKWLVVEAYDNPLFIGSPIRNSIVTNFNATKIGNRIMTVLGLPPGTFYIRSYLVDGREKLPNWYDNKNSNSSETKTILGAISTTEKIVFQQTLSYETNKRCPQSVILEMKKLVTNPNAEPITNARMRFGIKATDVSKIPEGRKVRIELRDKQDLTETPFKTFEIKSEQLLISTRPGFVEFVTPQLDLGYYFAFVYVDTNDNNNFDQGELSAWAMNGTHVAPVRIESNKTISIPIELK